MLIHIAKNTEFEQYAQFAAVGLNLTTLMIKPLTQATREAAEKQVTDYWPVMLAVRSPSMKITLQQKIQRAWETGVCERLQNRARLYKDCCWFLVRHMISLYPIEERVRITNSVVCWYNVCVNVRLVICFLLFMEREQRPFFSQEKSLSLYIVDSQWTFGLFFHLCKLNCSFCFNKLLKRQGLVLCEVR